MSKRKTFNLTALARSDAKDYIRLQSQARKGWHLAQVKIPYFSYELEEYEGEDKAYLIDYQATKDDTYLRAYKQKGWTHVCSYKNLHYFKGGLSTLRSYTDLEGKYKLYKKIGNTSAMILVVLLALNIGLFATFNALTKQAVVNRQLVTLSFGLGLFLVLFNLVLAYATFTYLARATNVKREMQ